MVRTRPSTVLARLLVAPATAAVVLAGVWVAGGVITDSFFASAALTGLWFAVSGLAALRVARSAPAVRWPLLGGYVATAAAVSVWLGWATLHDRVVDEQVVVGVPMSAMSAMSADLPPAANVEEAAGDLRSGEHTTSGRAAIVRLPDGRRKLTLTAFRTSAGPDLRVRLVPGATEDGGADGARDLGALKGNRGDQQYDVPGDVTVAGSSVIVWCRAFSATFGSAVLSGS